MVLLSRETEARGDDLSHSFISPHSRFRSQSLYAFIRELQCRGNILETWSQSRGGSLSCQTKVGLHNLSYFIGNTPASAAGTLLFRIRLGFSASVLVCHFTSGPLALVAFNLRYLEFSVTLVLLASGLAQNGIDLPDLWCRKGLP